MKRDKIQNSIIKFKDNDIDIDNECCLDNCDNIKTEGNDYDNYNDNNDDYKRNDDKINII